VALFFAVVECSLGRLDRLLTMVVYILLCPFKASLSVLITWLQRACETAKEGK